MFHQKVAAQSHHYTSFMRKVKDNYNQHFEITILLQKEAESFAPAHE